MPAGRAIWKERRGKDSAEELEAFDLWNQHAKTFARVRDIFAPETRLFYGLERLWGNAERIEVPTPSR